MALSDYSGQTYTTKVVILVGFILIEKPANAEGIYKESQQEVRYVYRASVPKITMEDRLIEVDLEEDVAATFFWQDEAS